MKRRVQPEWNFAIHFIVLFVVAISLLVPVAGILPVKAQQVDEDRESLDESTLQSRDVTLNTANHTLFLPVIDNGSCRTNIGYAKNHFGVQVYGYMGPRSPYYCALVTSGATWVRNEASWARTEPTNVTPDQYQWRSIDNVVEVVRHGGYNQILTINYNPSWAATYPQGRIDKVPLSEFTEFVGALVERYDGDGINDADGAPIVEYFELYNEPDAGVARVGDIRWGEYGKDYAEMLKTVYPAVKAANSNAKVLLGGIAYDWFTEDNGPFVREFLDAVLTNGGGDYFDIMNFHQYPPFAPNWGAPNGPGLVEKTEAIRAKLAEYGISKPIFITEAGMHSAPAPETPERQARYVTMLYTQALVANVDVLIWFMLYDPHPSYPFRNGLVTAVTDTELRPQPKPSFVAYQTAVSKLAGARYVRTLTHSETGDPDLLAYSFVDRNNKEMIVAWLGPIGREDVKPLRLTGVSATVTDIYGASRTIGNSNGILTIPVGAQPVYIYINR
jgi:hypothetical protein